MGRTGGGQPGGLEAIGSAMGFLGKLMGGEENLAPPKARGFLGLELTETDDTVKVKSVLPDSPAAAAGIKPRDTISQVAGRTVFSVGGVVKACGKFQPGESVKFTIDRGGKSQELTVKFGKGF
jgi:S1-C subfamily serine protease